MVTLWSDFTLGFSFKVKRCLNGFGEFSYWWIQFALVLRCDRYSFPLRALTPKISTCGGGDVANAKPKYPLDASGGYN